MGSCPLLEFCKCDEVAICLFCKILTIIFVAVISAIAGYMIGKRKKK